MFFVELFKIYVILGKNAHDITGSALENPDCTVKSPPPACLSSNEAEVSIFLLKDSFHIVL